MNRLLMDLKCDKVDEYDAEIKIENISKKFVKDIMFINKISGKGFRPLKFKLVGLMIDNIKLLKEKHIKFSYNDINFLIWNDTMLYDEYMKNNNLVLEIIGELDLNLFAGQTNIQFIIDKILKIETLDFRI